MWSASVIALFISWYLIILSHSRKLAMERAELIRNFAADRLELEIPALKISIISSPQTIDVLGLQTDGQSKWLRPRTRRRAEAKLKSKILTADENLLDSFCSYQSLSPNGMPFDWLTLL